MILDLHDPPVDPPEGSRQRLWLVPNGPPLKFKRVRDLKSPWTVRILGAVVGTIISFVVVLGIVAFGALFKDLWDRVDTQDRARHAQRAREAEARRVPEGTIPLMIAPRLPDQKPAAGSKTKNPDTKAKAPAPSK
jgi:hypothetical protein